MHVLSGSSLHRLDFAVQTRAPDSLSIGRASATGGSGRDIPCKIRRIFAGALPTELKVQISGFPCTSYPENRTKREVAKQNACIKRRSSPRAISTGQLHTLLHFHLRPIKQIVSLCPYSLKDERSYLRGSFTLRCFQRLSRPYLATQLCPWQNNWCTRGTSIPVLSY